MDILNCIWQELHSKINPTKSPQKDASFRETHEGNWSGYGIWISQYESQSFSCAQLRYTDSSSTVAELRAILLALFFAATKIYWRGVEEYLSIEIRTDCNACIKFLSGQKRSKSTQSKSYGENYDIYPKLYPKNLSNVF